jgi:hypothetical protein
MCNVSAELIKGNKFPQASQSLGALETVEAERLQSQEAQYTIPPLVGHSSSWFVLDFRKWLLLLSININNNNTPHAGSFRNKEIKNAGLHGALFQTVNNIL